MPVTLQSSAIRIDQILSNRLVSIGENHLVRHPPAIRYPGILYIKSSIFLATRLVSRELGIVLFILYQGRVLVVESLPCAPFSSLRASGHLEKGIKPNLAHKTSPSLYSVSYSIARFRLFLSRLR